MTLISLALLRKKKVNVSLFLLLKKGEHMYTRRDKPKPSKKPKKKINKN